MGVCVFSKGQIAIHLVRTKSDSRASPSFLQARVECYQFNSVKRERETHLRNASNPEVTLSYHNYFFNAESTLTYSLPRHIPGVPIQRLERRAR